MTTERPAWAPVSTVNVALAPAQTSTVVGIMSDLHATAPAGGVPPYAQVLGFRCQR